MIQEGGIAAVVSAMQAHKEHLGIQLSTHEALALLMNEQKQDSAIVKTAKHPFGRKKGDANTDKSSTTASKKVASTYYVAWSTF